MLVSVYLNWLYFFCALNLFSHFHHDINLIESALHHYVLYVSLNVTLALPVF